MIRIESLLSARLFLAPQVSGSRIYFISNLSGKLSLYAMNFGGSVPEPLLPPHIALQNPDLVGHCFHVLPGLGKILVMIDHDGDENYQPTLIPLEGGYPEPAFDNFFAPYRVHLGEVDEDRNLVYLMAESRSEPIRFCYRGDLESGSLLEISRSKWGGFADGISEDHGKVILVEGYSVGDNVLYLWDQDKGEKQLLFGRPIEERQPGEEPALNSIGACSFVNNNESLVFSTSLFEDTYGLGTFDLANPTDVKPVTILGTVHQGQGEFEGIGHLKDDRFTLHYNIDGCTWVYEGSYDPKTLTFQVRQILVGQGQLSNGKLESIAYDKIGDRFALAYSTATSPTQIYTIECDQRNIIKRHTNEKILGLSQEMMSPGEDASFVSYDGLRISARLYMPAPASGFEGPRPVVYYIHGGPQSQERPDFAWFSMPLIQFLTMNGFAVFVPNVRGSSGYGLSYMKQVDRDWGGRDRLDHVHAVTQVLPKDARLDVKRTAVVGRSYGGYMTLTLAGRHPDLWSAAVDMFGPYNLFTFIDRLPATWKPYFALVVGDPNDPADADLLNERSPKTYLDQLACPMLVIQGKNDPRVIERESRDVVEDLRSKGKTIEYLMFENEGHDVLKYENRVACYNAITDFFKRTLNP
jgi:pimeloyl-ACP methyl ester carboxylesterase